MKLAPIALFAYRRRAHVERAIRSLLTNVEARDTALYIFCDGPRTIEDEPAVHSVRQYLSSVTGFAEISLHLRPDNVGLAQSIITGTSTVLRSHERVIVLEDDLVVSPFFLRYMNEGLTCYQGDEQVASIHGYVDPVHVKPETFFLRGADCWGWATWGRAWEHFNPDAGVLLRELESRGLSESFDMQGAFPYTKMLRLQLCKRIDSWAIRWRASCYLAGMLTLYPGRSLVANIGMDGTGTHGDATSDYSVQLSDRPVTVHRIPLQEHSDTAAAISRYYRASRHPVRRLLRRLIRTLSPCSSEKSP